MEAANVRAPEALRQAETDAEAAEARAARLSQDGEAIRLAAEAAAEAQTRSSEVAAREAQSASDLERRAGDLAAEAERQRRAALAAEEQASAARREAEEQAQVARQLAAEAEEAKRAAEEEALRVKAHRESVEAEVRQRAESDQRMADELKVLCTHLELHLPDYSRGAMLQVLKDHVAKGLAAAAAEAEAQAAAVVSSAGNAEATREQAAAGAGGCARESLQASAAAATPLAAEGGQAAGAAEAAEGTLVAVAEGQQVADSAAAEAVESAGAAGAAGVAEAAESAAAEAAGSAGAAGAAGAGDAAEARARDVFAQIGATVIREKSDRQPAGGPACDTAATAAGQAAPASPVAAGALPGDAGPEPESPTTFRIPVGKGDSFADTAASQHQTLGRELSVKRLALDKSRADLQAAEAAHAEAAARFQAAEEAARPDAELCRGNLDKAKTDWNGLMREIDELKVLRSDFSKVKSEVAGKKACGISCGALDPRLKSAGVEQELISSLGLVLQRKRRLKGDMKVLDGVEEKLAARRQTMDFLMPNIKSQVARCEKAVADAASASELRAKELRQFAEALGARRSQMTCDEVYVERASSQLREHEERMVQERLMRFSLHREPCGICCEEFGPGKAVWLGCNHGWYCKECIRRFVEARLEAGNAGDIPCPSCGDKISEADLITLLPPKVCIRLHARAGEQQVREGVVPAVRGTALPRGSHLRAVQGGARGPGHVRQVDPGDWLEAVPNMSHGDNEGEPGEAVSAARRVPQDALPELQHQVVLQVPSSAHRDVHLRVHYRRARLHRPRDRKDTEAPEEGGQEEGPLRVLVPVF